MDNTRNIRKPFKDNFGFTDRDILWIYNNYPNLFFGNSTQLLTVRQKRIIVTDYIKSQDNRDFILNKITLDKDHRIVNESEFHWIENNNNRQLILLINILIKNYNLNKTNLTTTTNYDYFINIFDNINLNIDSKIQLLNNLRFTWSSIIINKNDTDWINALDNDQIIWAFQYLKKTNKIEYFPIPPTLISDRYEYIQASLDLIGHFINQDAKELYLLKMKKTWAQKKYRDKDKIKKPHHLPLTKDSHGKLKELSEIFDQPISGVLEFIIQKVYDEYIIDNQGKKKY